MGSVKGMIDNEVSVLLSDNQTKLFFLFNYKIGKLVYIKIETNIV